MAENKRKEEEKKAWAPELENENVEINYYTFGINGNRMNDYKKNEEKGSSIKTSRPGPIMNKEMLSTELERGVTIQAETDSKEEKEI